MRVGILWHGTAFHYSWIYTPYPFFLIILKTLPPEIIYPELHLQPQIIHNEENFNPKLFKIFSFCQQNSLKLNQNLHIITKIQPEFCAKMQNIDMKSALSSQKHDLNLRHVLSVTLYPHPEGNSSVTHRWFDGVYSDTSSIRQLLLQHLFGPIVIIPTTH